MNMLVLKLSIIDASLQFDLETQCGIRGRVSVEGNMCKHTQCND